MVVKRTRIERGKGEGEAEPHDANCLWCDGTGFRTEMDALGGSERVPCEY